LIEFPEIRKASPLETIRKISDLDDCLLSIDQLESFEIGCRIYRDYDRELR